MTASSHNPFRRSDRLFAISPKVTATLFAAFAVASANITIAGPLDHERVDRESAWVVHLDVEAGMNSLVGRHVAEKVPPIVAAAKLMQDRWGFDPRTSLHGVTLYGFAGEDDGVGIVCASSALDRFIERLPTTRDQYERHELDAANADGTASILHSWVEDGRKWFCCVRQSVGGERIALFACTRSLLDRAIRVMDGRESSLRGSACALGSAPRQGSIFFAAAKNMDRADRRVRKSEILRKSKSIVVDIGECSRGSDQPTRAVPGQNVESQGEREFFAEVRISAENEQGAKELRTLASGSLAVVSMAIAGQPDASQLADMLRSIVFEARGSELVMHARQSAARVVEALSKVTFPASAPMSHPPEHADGTDPRGATPIIPAPEEHKNNAEKTATSRTEGGR